MREIKFRAWDAYKRMWTEYRIHDGVVYFLDKSTGVWVGKYDKRYKEYDFMEYSGLRDKNNKEIYEGDILFESFGEKYYKVIFENGGFRAEFNGDFEDHSFDLIDVVAQSCEVIGNIYENSKLMEDE